MENGAYQDLTPINHNELIIGNLTVQYNVQSKPLDICVTRHVAYLQPTNQPTNKPTHPIGAKT